MVLITPLKLMQRSRLNSIEHIKLLIKSYNITYEEIFEDEEFLKSLESAINGNR